MENRTIIQISTAMNHNQVVFIALCDDGTLWKKYGDKDWMRVSPIPQT